MKFSVEIIAYNNVSSDRAYDKINKKSPLELLGAVCGNHPCAFLFRSRSE